MGRFKVRFFNIPGVMLFEPMVFEDDRGFFTRLWDKREMWDLGLKIDFVEVYHSFSKKGVLRGLHFQREYPQGKLVKVVTGEVFDVAVDLRRGSPTYGKWIGIYLSENNKNVFYIPKGFAHGFLALTNNVHFIYMVTDYYYPESDGGIRWNDPEIGIDWPLDKIGGEEKLIISKKDRKLPYLADIDIPCFKYSEKYVL